MKNKVKLYIVDLAAYTAGKEKAHWFDLDDYADASHLMEAIQYFVSGDYAVHDQIGISDSFIGEYPSLDDFKKLYSFKKKADKNNIPVFILTEAMEFYGEEDLDKIIGIYIGKYADFNDFLQAQIKLYGGYDKVPHAESFFNYENYGLSHRLSAPNDEIYDHLTDNELGRSLVDDLGGYMSLSDSEKQAYFNYEKFKDHLEYGYVGIFNPENGQTYIFQRDFEMPSGMFKEGGSVGFKAELQDFIDRGFARFNKENGTDYSFSDFQYSFYDAGTMEYRSKSPVTFDQLADWEQRSEAREESSNLTHVFPKTVNHTEGPVYLVVRLNDKHLYGSKYTMAFSLRSASRYVNHLLYTE